MRILTLAAVLTLAGCATAEKIELTRFAPTQDGFVFTARADARYPAGNSEAEARRMWMLESYLRDNGICPAGYTIADRREVIVTRGLLGDIVDITYQGACKPAP